MHLIDTHTHLEAIQDFTEAVDKAQKAGVMSIITVGSNYESNRRALEISGRYGETRVYAALGLHPWGLNAFEVDSTIHFVEENIKEAIAIGEVGLDFWAKEARKDHGTRDLQRKVFKRLLELSKHHHKPVLVHARGAWEECFHLIREAGISKSVFHWYSGSGEVLKRILEHGHFISATPAAEYSEKHRKAISMSPLERILLETDAPVEYQGKISGPADLVRSLNAVAELKNMKREIVADVTTRNALEFFGL